MERFIFVIRTTHSIVTRVFSGISRVLKLVLKYLNRKLNNFLVDAGRETGILAISLMVNRTLHPFERTLWLSIIIGSIYAAFTLSMLQINRYFNSATVVSVDRDYRDWNGSLPAVTLCYYDHIDSFKANNYIQDNWNISIVDEDYFYFMDFLYAVVNATASNYADLARFAEDQRFETVDLYDMIRAIDRPFEQVISSFDANVEVHVIPVMSERGSCYAINSPMSELLTRKSVDYQNLRPPVSCEFSKQQCFIKMDLFESTGTIDLHSPYEISTRDASIIALHKSDEIIATYKVQETVKSLCLARCRAVMALEMCNCVPFFYPYVDGSSCNPAGFECLLDFKWPIWALHICKCPSTCTEIEYTVQTVKKSSWGSKGTDEGAKTDVATSSFRWDLIPPKVRLRRDVVFSFQDLIVSFGGVLALFLGLSMLSFVHLGYVLILHILETVYEFLLAVLYCLRYLLQYCLRCKRHLQLNYRR